MRAPWIAIALVLAGCKGGGDGKPKPAPVIDAAKPVSTADIVDAGRAWYALPVDATPDARVYSVDTLPDLGSIGGPFELLMADAPVGNVLTLFVAPRTMAVGVSDPSQRITGRLTAEARIDLLAMLALSNHDQFPVPVTGAKGKGPDVDLQFAGANVRDLFRLLGDVERRNYILPHGTLPDVNIVAKRVPSDAVARAAATAAGVSAFDVHGNLTFVHDPAQPGLDPALVARKGPTVDLDARDAHAGELYAALIALGVDPGGGAGCTDGELVELRVKKVKAGVAIAAIAAVTGVAPGASACTPTDGDLTTVNGVHVIGHAGKHAVAIIADANGTGLVDSSTHPDAIGAGFLQGTTTGVSLYPDPGTGAVDPNAWLDDLPKARLAALLLEPDHRTALVEMPDGTTHVVTDASSYVNGGAITAIMNETTLSVRAYTSSGDVTATLTLRAK